MKVFQIASSTMAERGLERLRGLGLSTSALMAGVSKPRVASPVPPAASAVSQLDPQTPHVPRAPRNSQHRPCLTSGTDPLALSLSS